MWIFAKPDRGNAQSARSRLTDVIMVDRTAAAAAEITTLRQELAASKARVQEMGRHNATEAEHFRAICRRIDDWVSIMTTGHAALSDKTNELGRGVVLSRAEL
jgi:hypothetical protein